MFKFKRFFILLLLSFVLLSSAVLASDEEQMVTVEAPTTTAAVEQKPTTIDEDVFVSSEESYSLSDIIMGNIFASANKFTTNPRNNGGIINGNLFLMSQNATIQSDVVYSNNKDKKGNAIIDSINSRSVINGNVYVLADSFTIEAGSEVHGDIYAIANSVNIGPNVVVDGSIFVITSDMTLNGQIKGSVYAQVRNFTMDYYCYIQKDLNLAAYDASLDGIVNRTASITATNNLITQNNFKVNANLLVDYAEDFKFSGKVAGNAKINAQNLIFTNTDANCSIDGDLDYAIPHDTAIPEGIVAGKVTTSKFVDISSNNTSKVIFASLFDLVALLVYVFAVVFFAKLFAQKALSKLPEFNTANVFKAFGIGLASFIAIFIIFVGLCLLSVGIHLAFFMVVAYLFLLGLALPLFLNKIADILNIRLNSYIKLLIVVVAFYVITLIPVLGAFVSFISMTVGIGQILLGFFNRKI